MIINFSDVSNKKVFKITVIVTDFVSKVKEKYVLSRKEPALQVDNVIFVFSGETLEDKFTLDHYNIEDNDTILVIATLKGGI